MLINANGKYKPRFNGAYTMLANRFTVSPT